MSDSNAAIQAASAAALRSRPLGGRGGWDIRLFIANADNYCVLLHDPATGDTASVDAPNAETINLVLEQAGWSLTHILVTHKHEDHVIGIPDLRARYGATVIGPRLSAAETGLYDRTVGGGDEFAFGGAGITVADTPGHTLDHIFYHVPSQRLAFVGDTLFSMSCGRLFEGTPAMMWDSFKKIRALPSDTDIYCGHEYAEANTRFALGLDPENETLQARLEEVIALRARGAFTLPTTVALEAAANPFMRADAAEVAGRLGPAGADPVSAFAAMRQMKDRA